MTKQKEYRICLTIANVLLTITIFWNYHNMRATHNMSLKIYEATFILSIMVMIFNVAAWLVRDKEPVNSDTASGSIADNSDKNDD